MGRVHYFLVDLDSGLLYGVWSAGFLSGSDVLLFLYNVIPYTSCVYGVSLTGSPLRGKFSARPPRNLWRRLCTLSLMKLTKSYARGWAAQ